MGLERRVERLELTGAEPEDRVLLVMDRGDGVLRTSAGGPPIDRDSLPPGTRLFILRRADAAGS